MARHPRQGSISTRTRSILQHAIEPLERRSYLTTLLGGESFIFIDDLGEGVLVEARGDIRVELIGAVFPEPEDGSPGAFGARLGDIPGTIFGREEFPVNIRGGIGGPDPETVELWTGLWGIYVTASSPDAELVFTRLVGDFDDGVWSPEDDNPIQPFEGQVELNFSEDNSVSFGGGTGELFLGLRGDFGDIENFPVPSRNANQFDGDLPPGVNISGFITPQIVVNGPIGKFHFAGTISGSALFNGNVNQFYAGAVATGNITGGFDVPNDNFTIIGDVNQFVVKGYLGAGDVSGDFIWDPGTELAITGRVGTVLVGQNIGAKFDVVGTFSPTPIDSRQLELESRRAEDEQIGSAYLAGEFVDGFFDNDTIATAQPIFTGFNSITGRGNSAIIEGSINPTDDFDDLIDYYSIPLLAGQTLTVSLASLGFVPLGLGIIDPDGRIIASDHGSTNRLGQAVRIVADRPGNYIIAAADSSDRNFNGAQDDVFLFTEFVQPYELTVTASEASVGAIVARGDINPPAVFPAIESGIRIRNGDLGNLQAGGAIENAGGVIEVARGNLRVAQGGTIGLNDPETNSLVGIDFLVPRGNVGLFRGDGLVFLNPNALSVTGAALASRAIGGDIQVVQAGGLLAGNITANGSIGTIRANNMADIRLLPSVIAANVDRTGSGGVIDLIDVAGDMGTFQTGGPIMDAGPGGNIRYVRVGGQAYRNSRFGGGLPETTIFSITSTATITDDSGAIVTIRPVPSVNFTTGAVNNGQVAVTTLPASNGGSVILDVTSLGSVSITASGGGSLAGAEIGTLTVVNSAAAITDVQFVGLQQPFTGTRIDVRLGGGGRPVDVLSIVGNNFTTIENKLGEIVNISAGDIGTLAAKTLGFARRSTAAAVLPQATIAGGNAFPFVEQKTGIIAGNIIRAEAADGLGNFITTGTIQRLFANADGRFTKGVEEGIVGPIVVGGELRLVNIGEGLYPSGTGEVQHSGIYVTGLIGTIENQGPGTDIRGDIASATAIQRINLNGGSIIDAEVGTTTTPERLSELSAIVPLTVATGPTNAPIFDVGLISINGGGVLGSTLTAGNFGELRITNGFGIVNSFIRVLGASTINSIVTDGLGIRDSRISSGANTNNVTALGTTGRLLDIRGFTPSVQFSGTSAFDPFSGTAINPDNDLYAALGIGARTPKVSGLTNEGVIRDTQIVGSRNLGKVQAYQIDSSDNVNPPSDPLFPTQFNFGSNMGTIRTFGPISGLQLTTGSLGSLVTGGELARASITASGTVNEIRVGASIRGTTSINVQGGSGFIKRLAVNRNLFGEVVARRFGEISVGQDVGSGRLRSFGSIDRLAIGGNMLTGAYLRASGPIKTLILGGDLQAGATIRATSFSNQQIGGVIAGDLVVG